MVVTIIGGGLAGSEAAWQVASRGVRVRLHEMRPVRPTLVHQSDRLAELVCSNSFRGDKLDNAVGVLKEEMRRLGSVILRCADATRVPAGAALAVDRGRFSQEVTEAIAAHPLIEVVRGEVPSIPAPGSTGGPVIVATGPLTSDALSQDIAHLVGAEHLSFYDAISPIVLADTIDRSIVYRASRWGRSIRGADEHGAGDRGADERGAGEHGADERGVSERGGPAGVGVGRRPTLSDAATAMGGDTSSGGPACGVDDGEGDYLNCPMTEAEYRAFYDALITAESATVHDFDKAQFFEGCLPIEVMAHRGPDTLRFGPMKPVGLPDPRTGRIPFAVVQLRQDTLAGDHFSLVGFQTQLKWGEQARVLRMIPGLANAEFVRFGMVHRNTYINGPTILRPTWQVRTRDDLFFAGQVSGVEGYVESAASGLLAGINAARLALGQPCTEAPRETAIGALAYYVSHADAGHYQPSNITFGIMPPLAAPPVARGRRGGGPGKKALRNEALAARALLALDGWKASLDAVGAAVRS